MNENIKMVTANGEASVDELKGLLTMARSQGLNRIIIKVPVRLLAIDTRYQVDIRTKRHLGYLVNNWDERKLLPLVGVPHDEEGIIALVDGMGRTKASQIVDPQKYEYMECMVLLDYPSDQEDRLRFEAELFAHQNKDVAKLSLVQKHGALRCLDDKAILIMDKMKDKYGFEYIYNPGKRRAGVIGSYSELYHTCKLKGEECISYIFDIIKNSAFDRKQDGYAVYVVRSLRDAWTYYPENRNETLEFLSEYLRKYEPSKFKADAVSKYKMLDYKTAVSLHVEDLIVESFNVDHVRETDGHIIKYIGRAA